MSDDYTKFDGRREEPPYAGNVDEWGPIVEQLEDRIRALESLVRAADRMRGCIPYGVATFSKNDYDNQRAAVGEIGEE